MKLPFAIINLGDNVQQSVCLASLFSGVLCGCLAAYLSVVHSVFIVCVGDMCLLINHLLKFRNVLS